MTLVQLNNYLDEFLHNELFCADISLNGIQIENSSPDSKEIKKIAFAVDACEDSVKMAAKQNADVLIVHHGLFWGHCQTICGSHYKRISQFIKNDIALIACHIPLDANNPYGNNFGMANKLGLVNQKPFGKWRGMDIGAKGELKEPVTLQELADSVSKITRTNCTVLPFGKKQITTVGIISGGGSENVEEAAAQKLDAYITGEFAHEQYHYAKEVGINVIAAGHYGTETIGVSLLEEKIKKELELETVFLNLPTNL